MARVRVAIALERETLRQLDSLVAQRVFANRSPAIETALRETIERLKGVRLAAECAKLDRAFEPSLAEEGLGAPLLTACSAERGRGAGGRR
jgi:Arc/MetJ-type ribon-helix-helix transcriptional regulator